MGAPALKRGSTFKQCAHCHVDKPLTEFYARHEHGTRGYASWCKPCEQERGRERRKAVSHREYHKTYQKLWLDANPRKTADYTKAWRERHGGSRVLHLKQRYGLTGDQVLLMIAAQEGKCAICHREKELVVDHNKKTDAVRAMLCDQCNRGIGCLEENPNFMESAAKYVRAWNEASDQGIV